MNIRKLSSTGLKDEIKRFIEDMTFQKSLKEEGKVAPYTCSGRKFKAQRGSRGKNS